MKKAKEYKSPSDPKLPPALSGKKQGLYFPPDIEKFLLKITSPESLNHRASLADFIRNNVLEDIRNRIKHAQEKGSY